MRPDRRTSLALLALVAATIGLARDARALTACTAAQVISQDPGCPSGAGACNITRDFTVGDGCTLDFGARAVTIAATGSLDTAPGAVTILAGSFTVAPRGFLDGRGLAAPVDRGSFVTIQTTGAVNVQKSGGDVGRIDVSGDTAAGTLKIVAGGSVTIAGEISADKLSTAAAGGQIIVDAIGDVVTLPGSILSAQGGVSGTGTIDLTSRGRVDLGESVDISGDEGGELDLTSGAETIIRRVQGDATGDAGSGGSVTIVGGTRVDVSGVMSLKGSTSIDGTSGGCGGVADITASFGDITVVSAAQILALGAGPDGGGGEVDFSATGSVVVQAAGLVSAASNGGQGCGGMICIEATQSMSTAGTIDASGGLGGGSIDVEAAGDVTFGGTVTAAAFTDGGFGGDISGEAGFEGSGTMLVTGTVDSSGGHCSDINGCGEAGSTDFMGCDVTVASTGHVLAIGPSAGENTLTAREQLTVAGEVNASTIGTGTPGLNTFEHTSRKLPIVTGVVTPGPTDSVLATCTGPLQPACLDPCPSCGNGVLEWPEQCDDGGAASCDGCSRWCRFENCGDANACTTDSCDPVLGCRHVTVLDGTPCPDALACNGVEVCAAGVCIPGPLPNCNDNNACTADTCVEPAGCAHTPLLAGSPCTDNNACTLGDACDGAGACVTTGTLLCDDGKECTTDTCSPQTGCVFTNRAGSCTDDGNACTSDVCSAGLCTHPNRANGTACDDGAFCTVNDTCQNGTCTSGPARNCADTNACTADRCDDILDACVHDPIVPCCGNGVTEPAGGEECDDGNTSNTDACVAGCRNARCGDGFVEAGVEQCDAGAANADTPNAACRTDCRLPRCGDGITDTSRGEQCDDGNTAAGDGCSPRCYIEPPPTAVLIAGKGSAFTDCASEWLMDHPTFNRKGQPDVKQACRDGDPSCDFGTASGECIFHVWLCENDHDPRLTFCTPGAGGTGTVVGIDMRKPSSKDALRRLEDSQNRSELLTAAFAGTNVGFDSCGPRMSLRVPLKSAVQAGSKKLKLKARTTTGAIDADGLKLICNP